MFPDIDPKKIIFTPNFAEREEYEFAFKKNVVVTLDNLFPLEAWPKSFKGREIFVRIDPGRGQGHHKYVRTAGVKSKFGISSEQFEILSQAVKTCGSTVCGLHAHVGSNIFTPDTWSKTAVFLVSVAQLFPDVQTLDLGGGLGIVEKPGKKELDLAAVNSNLAEVKKAYPKFNLWMEPGRFLVAEAGVLLARVTQTKKKEEYNYVGINAGMNSLIRPALYGAHHEIINLTRMDEPADLVANIVGPICESGDILGYDRQIPTPKEGDVILIATAGAYGRVMSSNYNMRGPIEECFVE
jgi:diaminopimelate decarboxylase/aspartate kinase